MKNSYGFSWPESIVSLTVIFLIATTLLPLLSNMTIQLEEKKRKYHSSIVIHEAIKMYLIDNTQRGTMQIEKLEYSFAIDSEQICVHYEGMREEKSNCLTISYVSD
ncbi:type II secretion system protein [Psychrobacillus vulpis]|uniref:Type II secretion system protein n=1 Tax=Psychrobacillus vulpis TaxID=2325572 RepID=A0A544TQ24_9BACI|nr:type II secretion system protein [Psychrobacillus vulpis]TQR19557.1 type II secretion system protein [Psychrobacillus vulpis]